MRLLAPFAAILLTFGGCAFHSPSNLVAINYEVTPLAQPFSPYGSPPIVVASGD